MRIGLVGLNALYWPVSIGDGLVGKPGVQFLAAATLGVNDEDVRKTLGMTSAEYAAKYKIKLYTHAEDMIASEKLDTVAIVTRHSEHADWVERLGKFGVNIYLPKTFATTPAEAERIVRAEKQNGIRVAVGPSARFLPQLAAVKHALDEDLIGKPFSLRISHHHGTIDGFSTQDWYRDPKEGGPELSLGWYGIDLAIHFMGDEVKSVFAKYGNYTTSGSPFMDCGRMVMEMKRGGMASFDMYFCNRVNYPAWQLEIVGPKGVISIHRIENNSSKTVVGLDGADGYRVLPVSQEMPHWERFWVDEFAQGLPLSVSAEYARQVTLISLASRESARTGKVVQLS
jgi:predicted dehydrogenase